MDCFRRVAEFVLAQFDYFRKETDAGMMPVHRFYRSAPGGETTAVARDD
jgi:hypothetical protein